MKIHTKTRNRKFDVRVHNEEYLFILRKAHELGHKSVSAYLRDLLSGKQ